GDMLCLRQRRRRWQSLSPTPTEVKDITQSHSRVDDWPIVRYIEHNRRCLPSLCAE
ncbi:hypothetical protein BgiMline_018494, partial [Biomphalaria glabrata]